MHLRFTLPTLTALLVVAACSRHDEGAAPAGAARASAAPASSPGAAAPAGIGPGGKPICPANGLWAACSILERLDRAGLAPRRDSGVVHEAPLTAGGMRVHLGGADVEIFLYADSAARKADEARLDRHKFITADQEPSLAGERTIIDSANLLALLNSRDDHQRERVSDAITAGPPQP